MNFLVAFDDCPRSKGSSDNGLWGDELAPWGPPEGEDCGWGRKDDPEVTWSDIIGSSSEEYSPTMPALVPVDSSSEGSLSSCGDLVGLKSLSPLAIPYPDDALFTRRLEARDIAHLTLDDARRWVGVRGDGSVGNPFVIDGVVAKDDGGLTEAWVDRCMNMVVGSNSSADSN